MSLKPLSAMGWVVLLIRVLFGGVFIWTSVWHSTHAKEFLQSIKDYQIISGALVSWSGFLFIAAEAAIGVCLIFGFFVRQMSIVATVLLAGFTGVIVSAIVRQLDIACGCGLGDTKVGWFDVVRDAVLIAVALFIFWGTGKEEKTQTAEAAELSAAK